MKYTDGSALRRALEDRLRAESLSTGIPLVRLRKTVAFERFLARLVVRFPEGWALKGGFHLQLRFGIVSRSTKDIDLAIPGELPEIRKLLAAAGMVDLRDGFSFEVSTPAAKNRPRSNVRAKVQSLLDDRIFETFHIDLGLHDPAVDRFDWMPMSGTLDFADIPSPRIPCYPVAQQVAEKVHALTRPHVSGTVSRVKDFVDLLILAQWKSLDDGQLSKALSATFDAMNTHPLPGEVPRLPVSWESPFRKLANEAGLSIQDFHEGVTALHGFLEPVLSGAAHGTWNPDTWKWKRP
jgi:predicted nucleotidyltransferase component of viral defense system